MQHKIVLNSNCYHGYSIEDAIEGAHRAGFRYIELRGWTEHVFPTMSFARLQEIKSILSAAKISPVALSGHCNLMDRERLRDFADNIRLAGFFQCEYIISSVGEAHLSNNHVASDREVVENICGLLPLLSENGLRLMLEVHGAHGSGKLVKKVVDAVGSSLVAINYDTANAIFYGKENLEEDLDACIGNIGYMHVKDKAGVPEEWNFPALGQGTIDFPMIFHKLEQAGNNCPLSLEIEFTKTGAESLEAVNQAVADSAEYLRSLSMAL